MIENRMLTCIVCPLGCSISVTLDNGSVREVKGFSCKRGEAYALAECTNPLRMVTSTVRVVGGLLQLVPVKTDKPIPKTLIMNCMGEINRIRACSPIKTGDILLENILGTGANIVATCNA